MKQNDLQLKIEQSAKTIFSYCVSRTNSKEEAEDLSQDIILELIKSACNLRDDKAFYGFMWSVANNVYKNWCKKRNKNIFYELDENQRDEKECIDVLIEKNSELTCLKRELALLRQQYRKATVFYYFDNLSVSQISTKLCISESMVKYLLFKARKILKEGMEMERSYGEQSYNPKSLTLMFWGGGTNRYYELCKRKIPQNILIACYNDALTLEELSLQTGVATAYLEEDIEILIHNDILIQKGKKYLTNVVIFTKEFTNEVNQKASSFQKDIARTVINAINEKENEIRSMNFCGSDMNENTFRWQILCFLIYQAIIVKLENSIDVKFPKTKFGDYAFIWGAENFDNDNINDGFGLGISNVENTKGDYIQFMDFPINSESMVHNYFYSNVAAANVFFDIANGKQNNFSDNDLELIAQMLRRGYLKKVDNTLIINCPIFDKLQYEKLVEIFDEATDQICIKAKAMIDNITSILLNHTPNYLHESAREMSFLRLFEDAISVPVRILYQDGFIFKQPESEMLPTTYIIMS